MDTALGLMSEQWCLWGEGFGEMLLTGGGRPCTSGVEGQGQQLGRVGVRHWDNKSSTSVQSEE